MLTRVKLLAHSVVVVAGCGWLWLVVAVRMVRFTSYLGAASGTLCWQRHLLRRAGARQLPPEGCRGCVHTQEIPCNVEDWSRRQILKSRNLLVGSFPPVTSSLTTTHRVLGLQGFSEWCILIVTLFFPLGIIGSRLHQCTGIANDGELVLLRERLVQ